MVQIFPLLPIVRISPTAPLGDLFRQEIFPALKFLTPRIFFHWEIFLSWNSSPQGNPSHQEILPIRNLSHRELLPTRKSFVLPTRNSFSPGKPSHRKLLLTGNNFPPGNLSCQEILPIGKGNSSKPGNSSQLKPGSLSHQDQNPSHREMLPTRKSFSMNELIMLGNDIVVSRAYWIYLLLAKNFSKNSEI